MKKFDLGITACTPAALKVLGDFYTLPIDLLERHASGDWGCRDCEGRLCNEAAVKDGSRILSSYFLSCTKVWVLTQDEGQYCRTTILLPSEVADFKQRRRDMSNWELSQLPPLGAIHAH